MRLPSVLALFAVPLGVVLPAVPTSAHPGGLDASGCHHNRKTGEYHCHRGGSAPATARTFGLMFDSPGRAFRNCAEARAAGAAPARQGVPGYSRRLDRDGDGVGCE